MDMRFHFALAFRMLRLAAARCFCVTILFTLFKKMATEVYTDVYPQWLMKKEKKRRMVTFAQVGVSATEVAGYRVEMPFTGTNYAYAFRLDDQDHDNWKKNDAVLKNGFLLGLVYTAAGLLYAGKLGGWKYPLLLAALGVATTEARAWWFENDFKQYKHVGDLEHWVREEYAKAGWLKKNVDQSYRGDMELFASQIWYSKYTDKISRFQGISLVFNVSGGFAAHRFLWKRVTSTKQAAWFLVGLLACAPLLSDLMAAYATLNPDSEMAGNSVDHLGHAVAFLEGLILSIYLK